MIVSTFRYESRAGGAPSRTASSQSATWRLPASASEYTATVRTPSRRAVIATRHAISPRFAIRILVNMDSTGGGRRRIVAPQEHAAHETEQLGQQPCRGKQEQQHDCRGDE